MEKEKLEEMKKENEKLENEFWKEFYETKKLLTKSLERIKNQNNN